ncbi:nucleolar GTP-binding protein 1 [Skeletonema marinoi]|uniref:Nucleolar GTP-binding protein 1 n=1 Tax=Skeletonema marinoi TaxID=267567 RepID=A0AAD8Y6T2_9STRA|nr:nucleolar GTP-binding protein 1 [Skeletonema marinoi]|mmetsp:Transcript_28659/g.57697  ORF Transcript_28659/g.57697 Transcript_28659/m.57697 type:complete len:722 (+) Transcript_28659:126-2291(+)
MPVYNFKKMAPVPSASDFVDIVLTRTQRKTPTVVHPGYKITRIRSFYMRKIKFTQQTISDRLTAMLADFPRLSDIHPFYSDLCNTLYDRDHYKLALGQINTAKQLVDAVARDMIRMVKYGDSLYRCKCLKRAALGRMCTILKRQKASLSYLEEVRKHMSRLPALDPNTRTLLMCGLPNVGKSSFMNKITRANVDVQPYAFTTKSLFVGHTDYKYLRWQVIDTPGILDHSLEQRNTIEMQAITALAHLTCSVLYFMDISEQCGYTIEQQCNLFRSIQPLFANKQLVVVINKIDAQPWETLEADRKKLIEDLLEESGPNTTMLKMSNVSEEGVSQVKNEACEKLLAARVDSRVSGNKVDSVMNRLQVVYPTARDGVTRDAFIPESVKKEKELGAKKPKKSRKGYAPTVDDSDDEADDTPPESDDEMIGDDGVSTRKKTARELMWENGGPGVWAPDYREQYDLADPEWRFDAIPQILDGKNIADYVDPDIDDRLRLLEEEEDQLAAEYDAANMQRMDDDDSLDEMEKAQVSEIRDRVKIARAHKERPGGRNRPALPREIRGRVKDMHDSDAKLKASAIEKRMDKYGVDTGAMLERGRKRERDDPREIRRRKRDAEMEDAAPATNEDEEMEDGRGKSKGAIKRARKEREQSVKRASSQARSHSRPREPSQMGLKDDDMAKVAKKVEKQGQFRWHGGAGEGDHTKAVHLVKWMNTGKKRNGTHYCR